MNYYLIHGVDKSRGPKIEKEFEKSGIDKEKVTWILYPNKDEISFELRSQIVMQHESWTCGEYSHPGCPNLSLGQISCTYKHYLALKDIVEKNMEYAVIMEDNIEFKGNVPERLEKYIDQLNTNYPDWDILFDSDWSTYYEGPIIEGRYVYPKSNDPNTNDLGGTRCAHFYLIRQKCAKLLFENYLPFNMAPDWWMNDLFRNLNIKSFWAEPTIVHMFPHISTA